MAASIEDTDRGSQAWLQLDGLGTPIVTQVTRSTQRGMTVEQTLPFLRLHTVVRDATEQRSRIESVSMVVYDGVPRLVLDLAYDGRSEAPEDRRAHAGVVRPRDEDQQAALDEVLAHSDQPVGRESTLLFHHQPPVQAEPAHTPTDLTLEQELLRSQQLSYRLEQRWQAAQPYLERLARAARRGLRWLSPRLGRAWALSSRALAAALQRARQATQSSKPAS